MKLLATLLIKAGRPLLAEIVRKKAPGAALVVQKIAAALQIEPTAAAIEAEAAKTPAGQINPVVAAIAEAAADPEVVKLLAAGGAAQAALIEREDARESFFSWGWRPAMSWLLIFLWSWNGVLAPLVGVAVGAPIAPMPWEHLLGFSGLWLAIYGGGHTLKSIMGAKAG